MMKRSALIVIVLLLISISGIQAQNLNKVYGAMAEEDWEVALELLNPILEKKKKNYEAKWLAATCHSKRYRFEEAYRLFQEAAPFAEQTPFYWINYAEAYLFNGRVEDAERTLRRVNSNELDDLDKPFYFKIFNNIQNAKIFLPNPKDIIVKNLGPNVNTEGNEYSQAVTSDQRGIFFTARREGLGEVADDGEYYEQIMTAEMDDFDRFVNDKLLEGYSADNIFEAPIQLMDNDSTLVTFREDDLFLSRLGSDGQWGNREPLPINTGKWDSHVSIYNNGNSMIYASSFGNNDENSDLYIVHKTEDGKWSQPYFVEELNTSEREDAPFVAGDGTLYFSSKGHDSMGGYDIFSTRLDSATGKFSKPENMGAPINLPTDDTFFTLYGKWAYFSSSRPEGYGEVDIYRVILFDESQIQGKLIDCDNQGPVANATITVVGREDEFTATSNASGVYSMNMPIEEEFTLRVERDGEVLYEKEHTISVLFRDEFDIEEDFYIGSCDRNQKEIFVKMINSYDLDPTNIPVEEPEGLEAIVEAEPEPAPEPEPEPEPEPVVVEEVESTPAPPPAPVADVIELPNVYFDFDKHNVKSDFFERLDEAADLLMSRTDLRVMVAGHTDAYGTNPYNVSLGERRYTEVYNYLINKGVDPDQLEVGTFSEDIPIASNRTISGRAFNRRVELYFIDEDGNRK